MPSDAELAAGNPDAEEAALNAMEAEIFRIMKDKQDLEARMGKNPEAKASEAAKEPEVKASEAPKEAPKADKK